MVKILLAIETNYNRKCYEASYIYLMLSVILISIQCQKVDRQFTYPNWKLHYPQGSMMGLFLAAAIPLYLPKNSAYLAFNWEANYRLPNNETELTYPPIIKKRINRKLVYNVFEEKLKLQGYSGQACLLRIICEAATNTISEGNGILGNILHIILTPSTSKNQGLSNIYKKAEDQGKTLKQCKPYHTKCSVSFLDLISWLGYVAD